MQHTIIFKRAEFDEGHFPMRSEPNPRMTTSLNKDIEHVDAKLKEHPSSNSEKLGKEEEPPAPESEASPIEETTTDLPNTEPIGIGARLSTQDRQCPMDWWKPLEPMTSQKDSSLSEDTDNSVHEPHGKPRNNMEVMKHQDTPSWERAAQEEMSNHLSNQTWLLVPHPKDGNVIRSRWVFHLKYNADGSIEWHKAILVAKVYSQ